MTVDPLIRHALQVLARGHQLYSGHRIDPSWTDTPNVLRGYHNRLRPRMTAEPANAFAAARSGRMANALRQTAAADTELIRVWRAAHAGHQVGHHRTLAIVDDAYADPAPAADTLMGRREAMRRMVDRLQTQRSHIRRSRRQSRRLARRMHRLDYPGQRQTGRHRPARSAHPVGVSAVRYSRSAVTGDTRQWIAAALDRLGVTDRQARRNWIHGYQTLIARESGGRPSAVASEPATAPGPPQSDGHRLGYARGLTQTIPATFARYHQPGTSLNIYDPVANICASMNYVIDRYGVSTDGSNLATRVQQADPLRSPKGY